MSNQTESYEPLTSQNAALVLVDHQVGLMTGVVMPNSLLLRTYEATSAL